MKRAGKGFGHLATLSNADLFTVGADALESGDREAYAAVRKEQARRAGPETADPNALIPSLESPQAFYRRMMRELPRGRR